MQCQNCHSELPEGARFCSECGTSIAPAPQAAPTPSEVFQSSPFDQEQGASHAASEPTEVYQAPASYQEYGAPAPYQEYAAPSQLAPAPTAYASAPGTPAPGAPYAGYPAPGFPSNANDPYATQSAYAPYFAGTAPNQPRRRKKTALIVTLVTVIALVVLLGGGITYFVAQNNQRSQAVQGLQWDNPNALYSGVQALPPTTTSKLDSASGNSWTETVSASNSHPYACEYKDAAYHVTLTKVKTIYTCKEKTSYSDFAMQIDATIAQGDEGGISFRYPSQGNHYTLLYSTQGAYRVLVYSGGLYKYSLLSGAHSDEFKTGSQQVNTLMLIAHKSTFHFYVNGKFVNSFIDNTYANGALGLTTYARNSTSEMSFSNLKIWRL
ncbi:hypothetical protein KSD_63200 [Ktedonobacter sp. SOSP1-85]|uniref:family 16 glycoside hydrolase n=1 Tax=Ktedonobacter sp. SOSP1-85 TaxID=2778367 RepID=UPI0019166466|nr:family 16 glycoside hydrolase [Ktedonobacter sp. SOSP1-85]GHO78549.1 hypothetical protein KSD_63200 [Ktedonobacter sp. SOSP1-85]